MRESINTVVDQKYWSILLLFIALHFLWAYLTISFFPIIGIEEPGYTIHSYNLATKGKLINDKATKTLVTNAKMPRDQIPVGCCSLSEENPPLRIMSGINGKNAKKLL